MLSEKNSLQEYCQKNKCDMPLYKSWSVGEHHKLEWYASVEMIFNGKKIIIETDDSHNSKTSAEKSAATLMLQFINNGYINKKYVKKEKITRKPDSNEIEKKKNSKIFEVHDQVKKNISLNISRTNRKKNVFNDISTVYLIDLENKPMFKTETNDRILYIGFMGSIHHSIKHYASWNICVSDNIKQEVNDSENNKLIYLIDGGTPDLADHMMTAFLYPVVELIENNANIKKIAIITSDHAGWCTRACLEKILKWKNIVGIELQNSIL